MKSLNERFGTTSLSTTVLLLPALGSVPAAAAKGEALTLKGPGSCGYSTYDYFNSPQTLEMLPMFALALNKLYIYIVTKFV